MNKREIREKQDQFYYGNGFDDLGSDDHVDQYKLLDMDVTDVTRSRIGGKRRWISVNKRGMELVQVAILIAIAVGLGIIFKDKIGEFVNGTFSKLMGSGF